MILLRHDVTDPLLQRGTAAVIGNFDGVHRGHQALFTAVSTLAKQVGLSVLVIVFEPQTREFFLKAQAPPRITSLRKKLEIFQQLGADFVYCVHFNQRMAQMTALEFAQSVIFSQLHVKHLFIGKDFRFGHARLGDPLFLQKVAETYQARVDVYPDVLLDDCKISSTAVRHALRVGDLHEAERLLGRPFSLSGRVMYGDAQARQWGIPTANIKLSCKPLPVHGVFCVRIFHNGKIYQGVANMGCRPTLDGMKNLLEIHLFDFQGSLYGQRLEVIFLQKLRDEQRFSSKEALIAQIRADVAAAQRYFSMDMV